MTPSATKRTASISGRTLVKDSSLGRPAMVGMEARRGPLAMRRALLLVGLMVLLRTGGAQDMGRAREDVDAAKSLRLRALIELPPRNRTLDATCGWATKACGMPLCYEFCFKDHGVLPGDPLVIACPDMVRVSDVLQQLSGKGFTYKVGESSILISYPGLGGVKENPLDAVLPGFRFEGTHNQLHEHLRAVTPQNVDLVTGGGVACPGSISYLAHEDPFSGIVYKIRVDRRVTIREVLQRISDQYGVAWSAGVGAADRVSGSDGPDPQRPITAGLMVDFAPWACWAPRTDEKGIPKGIDEVIATGSEEAVVAAVNRLIWIDDPQVIGALAAAGRRFPALRHRVVWALHKFFDNDRARSVILSLAEDGDINSLDTALAIHGLHKQRPSIDFCKNVLRSDDVRKLYIMLEFLVENGRPEHVALVEPLCQQENEMVKKKALQFLQKQRAAGQQ